MLVDSFHVCNFSHVKRIGNSVTHFLARRSISDNKLQVWIEFIPNDIALLVTHDSLKLCFSPLINLTLESAFSKKKNKKIKQHVILNTCLTIS